MAAPKQSIYTTPSDIDTAALSTPTDYDLYGGQGNVNADQPNGGNYTTPVSKAAASLKSLKNWRTS
jgi:hypothetical protein